MSWNVLVGNLTKYIVMNKFIMIVKKKEVKRQGKRSQFRKPFTEDEYEFAIRKMDSYGEEQVRYFFIYLQASMSMIGKIDDTSKLLSENLKENQKHLSYSTLCKLCRSKYVKMMNGMCQIRYCSGLRTHLITF